MHMHAIEEEEEEEEDVPALIDIPKTNHTKGAQKVVTTF
jgi:hypothetical protein